MTDRTRHARKSVVPGKRSRSRSVSRPRDEGENDRRHQSFRLSYAQCSTACRCRRRHSRSPGCSASGSRRCAARSRASAGSGARRPAPAAHVVAAVPLEPAAGILAARIQPLRRHTASGCEALTPKQLSAASCCAGAQLRARKPALRELGAAVGHVLAAEHAELQHLPRRQLRRERRIEVPSGRLGAVIDVSALHPVVDHDPALHNPSTVYRVYRGSAAAGCSQRQGGLHGVRFCPDRPLCDSRSRHAFPDVEVMKQLRDELGNFERIAELLVPKPGDLPRLSGFDVYGGTLALNGIRRRSPDLRRLQAALRSDARIAARGGKGARVART